MANIHPASLANLRPPWSKGDAPGRRSLEVEKCLQKARRGSGRALDRVFAIMDDPNESTRYRLDAAKVILQLAMPKDPAALERMLLEMGGRNAERVFRIEFVDPIAHAPVVIDAEQAKPNGHANGHDPVKPVFVDPEEQDGP